MTDPTPADSCRPIEVDGETVLVRGSGDWTAEDQQHMAEIVRAAKRRYEAEHPAEPARRHTVDTLTDPELTRLYSELEAAKYDAEMRQHREVRHRARAERAEAKLERVRRALHGISIGIGRHRGTGDPEALGYRLGLMDADRQLRTALDEQQEQQT